MGKLECLDTNTPVPNSWPSNSQPLAWDRLTWDYPTKTPNIDSNIKTLKYGLTLKLKS